ncbi:MAG: ribonuclease P protein component [Nitriliruptorales bacterium]|nr:ribonuclease P protein component [Nitriliruptorales bacterium]
MIVDRLRRSEDIATVFQDGRHRAGRLAVCHVRDRGDDDPPRLTVVASRKVGKAVARNRAKRLLREASRRVAWRDGLDIVLVARGACANATTPRVTPELTELAETLDAVTVSGVS